MTLAQILTLAFVASVLVLFGFVLGVLIVARERDGELERELERVEFAHQRLLEALDIVLDERNAAVDRAEFAELELAHLRNS